MAEMLEIGNLRQYLGLATNKHNKYKSKNWLRGWRMNKMEMQLFGITQDVYGYDLAQYLDNKPIVPVKEVILDIYRKYKTQSVRRVAVWCYPEKFTFSENYWKKCREQILASRLNICVVCGSTENLHVDHKLPKSKYPHLMYCTDNLQILCETCNLKKGTKVEKKYLTELKHLLSLDVSEVYVDDVL
jgi:5-methylcytosine-specific restriction endonuclease McrA